MDGMWLEHVSEFQYFGDILDDSGTKLECQRVLHEALLMPVLMYGGETMMEKEKDRSRIRAHNLRNLLDIRRMDKVLNTQIREVAIIYDRSE